MKNLNRDKTNQSPELTDTSMVDVSMTNIDRDVIEVTSGDSSSTYSNGNDEFMSPMSRFGDDGSPRNARFGEEGEEEPVITEEEKELTKPVQGWLDVMNSASSRMNDIESELSVLESRRVSIATNWSNQKNLFIDTIGVYYIEKARPLFDAYQEQQKVQDLVNTATASYSSAVRECERLKRELGVAQNSGDDDLFQLLESYLLAQRNRETFEQQSQDRMNEFRATQSKCQELRKTIGSRIIDRAWPWFEAYNKCRVENDACAVSMRELRREMKNLREKYKEAMSELESISAQVHNLRK